MSLDQLRQDLREFVRERDWEQYHDPKNLATGLSIEASELLELFLWTRTEDAAAHAAEIKTRLSEEIGDVFLYCLMLADVVGLDPVTVARDKLALNREKYPVDLARGRSDKYDQL